MALTLATLAYLVRDYDEAIAFFTRKLGFRLLEDSLISPTKRWVRVGPAPASNSKSQPAPGATLLLARAANARQRAQVGKQGGGRVWLFLQTSQFWADYRRMKAAGVEFTEEPRNEPYGWVVVFADLYGNRWDLVEAPKKRRKPLTEHRSKGRSEVPAPSPRSV
jgi:catechol 2,3-dioxygenase-like lactoylglutathione lyase family enzyme